MKFWLLKPFSRNPRTRESGNVLLVVGMIASAVAVVGGKVMLDRTLAQRKANQLAENVKRSKEIPGSAAMIAKALISLPPHVANNQPAEWLSGKPYAEPANRPILYPEPYVSGAIGSTAQMARSLGFTGNTKAATNWDMNGVADATTAGDGKTFSANVNVYTNDSARSSSGTISTALSSNSTVDGSATLKRTKSVVNYRFRNCDASGRTSAAFTGRYCASALVTSENYASAQKGVDVKGANNKAMVELGLVETPPAPEILEITSADNASIEIGPPTSLVIRARGVATGYKVMHGTESLVTETSNISLPLNQAFAENSLTIQNINTSTPSLVAKRNDPCEDSVTISVTLKGIIDERGVTRDVTEDKVFDIKRNLVSCVPGSFSIRRRDDVLDKRTCSIQLRRDSSPGTVKEIQLDQDNISSGVSGNQIFGSPVFDGAGQWSFSNFACSQDKFTFIASLARQTTCASPSVSLCTPQDVEVPELVPRCASFMIGRTPNSMTDCTVTVDRKPDSHYGVDVFVKNQRQTGGAWTGNRWEMTNYPCGAGASSNYEAKLVRGSEADGCPGSLSVSENPWCVGVSGARPAPGKCTLSFTKNNAAAPTDITKIEREELVGGSLITTVVTDSTWSGNVYTSPQFDCPGTQLSFQGFLTGNDSRRSSCGFAVIDKASYTLTTSVTGSGAISKSPNASNYPHGDTVTLTATPNTGHIFTNWGGACSGTSNPCTVTMDGNKSVVANFASNTSTLTTSVIGGGSIIRSHDASSYNNGTAVTLTAVPASSGYIFKNWSGDCSGTSTTCVVVMNSNKTVTATFDISNQCTETVTYNPEAINCQIAINSTSFWDSVTDWQKRQNFMSNQTARWISTQNTKYKNGQPYCGFMPATDLITYVSHFRTGAGSTYKFEGIGDGHIQDIYIWKNGDPVQGPGKINTAGSACFVSNPTHAGKNGCVHLPPRTLDPDTLYTIWFTVAESGADYDGNASGGVLSVLDSSNSVLRKTDSSKTGTASNWCVYRASSSTAFSTFIPNVARCKWCYRGRP